MKPIKISSKDPYTEIANIIEEWCRKNFYDSFVVTISRDGQIITEYLELDGMSMDFIWENDWYEGEKDIVLLGFMPMLQLRVYGAGETNYDKVRAMNIEEMAEFLSIQMVAEVVHGWKSWLDWLKQEAKE